MLYNNVHTCTCTHYTATHANVPQDKSVPLHNPTEDERCHHDQHWGLSYQLLHHEF